MFNSIIFIQITMQRKNLSLHMDMETNRDAKRGILNYSENHGFKYKLILIHIGNIVSEFELPNTILTL